MDQRKNFGGLDRFKLAAAFLVVAIHTSPLASYNDTADFILTRIIARTAVPFFLMVTGYFLLPEYLFERGNDVGSLMRWLKKVLVLYAAAILLYLPVNLYAGHLKGAGVGMMIRLLLFDGTFYHLWYLPASILGVLLVYLLSRRLPFRAVLIITLLLYGIGLPGDSYYGLIEGIPFIKGIYDAMFRMFSYTRNGFFYAPVFLVMGAWASCAGRGRQTVWAAGLLLSFSCMLAEGLLLHHFGVQRHDSMYLCLLPCMFFLFHILLGVKRRSSKELRIISTCMYLVHPLFIVAVRGTAKLIHMEEALIDNQLYHYVAVCALSFAFSLLYAKLLLLKWKRRPPFLKDRAWIELNRDHLRHNVDTLLQLLPPGCCLMPAVKANAYGHGAVLIARELNAMGISAFCVATAREGVTLRRGGIRGEILVLGYTHPGQFSLLRRYHLIQSVVDPSYAETLSDYGKKLRVHLKIDTGMHRLGVRCERMDEICRIFGYKNLSIEGAYTHLCADETRIPADRDFTYAQARGFYGCISLLKKRGFNCPKVHLLATGGLLNYPELAGDYARIGIAIYGTLSNRSDMEDCPVSLAPVLSLKARVASVRDLFKGEAAGYGLEYVAGQDRKIAALTIGYGDGLPRALSCGVGRVLIGGGLAPVIGRICMDQTLVDVTELPNVRQGDIAVVIGRSGGGEITALDVAEWSGSITNEVLSRLGERLERLII